MWCSSEQMKMQRMQQQDQQNHNHYPESDLEYILLINLFTTCSFTVVQYWFNPYYVGRTRIAN